MISERLIPNALTFTRMWLGVILGIVISLISNSSASQVFSNTMAFIISHFFPTLWICRIHIMGCTITYGWTTSTET